MNLSYRAYRLLSTGLFMPVGAPVLLYWRLTGKRKKGLSERLGRYDRTHGPAAGRPRIWLHAVSVGEVRAASAIAFALQDRIPSCSLILSTTTEAGQVQAQRAARGAACVYAPLDAAFAVRSALDHFRPDLLAVCETELWPNWLIQARMSGVCTALVNGRISPRSFRRYMRIPSLIKSVLDSLQVLSMINEADADRICKMGADRRRIRINGNAKYEQLTDQALPEAARKMAELLCIEDGQPILVAGSIRSAEIESLTDAFCRIRKHLPRAVLIAAPRHLGNAAALTDHAKQRGLTVQKKSLLADSGVKRTASVVVLDTIGDLMAAYGTATVAFCGGSLAPLGGQNILEPAAWAKPVLYGPSMDDFLDAREILEREGGGEAVADAQSLAQRALFYMTHPQKSAAAGQKALKAAASQTGAARRHAEEIVLLLKETGFALPGRQQ